MFEKRVVVGKQYCVFAPGPVTITASMNNTEVKLVNATSAGKYFFIAPTTKIYSSIDTKCIFEPDNSLAYNIGNNPSWLYSLKAALQILLGETAVIINLAENKLIVHTDRADDTQLEAMAALFERVLPKNIVIEHGPLPLNYTKVEYLESSGEQYIELPFYYTNELGAELEYTDFYANNDAPMMSCSRYDGKYGRFYLPYTSSNIGYYGWESWINLEAMTNAGVRSYSKLNYTNDRKWCFEFGGNHRGGNLNSKLGTQPLSKLQLFCYNAGNTNNPPRFVHGRVFSANVSLGERIAAKLVPCLSPVGAPCMFDLVSKTPFYNEGTGGDFLYPGKEKEPTTFSLRRPITYAQRTEHGLCRLYHVPKGYNGTKEEYAVEHGFKPLVETEPPEDGYWVPQWRETEDEIVLEWVETEPPAEESFS